VPARAEVRARSGSSDGLPTRGAADASGVSAAALSCSRPPDGSSRARSSANPRGPCPAERSGQDRGIHIGRCPAGIGLRGRSVLPACRAASQRGARVAPFAHRLRGPPGPELTGSRAGARHRSRTHRRAHTERAHDPLPDPPRDRQRPPRVHSGPRGLRLRDRALRRPRLHPLARGGACRARRYPRTRRRHRRPSADGRGEKRNGEAGGPAGSPPGWWHALAGVRNGSRPAGPGSPGGRPPLEPAEVPR
jgi:hypothetical protein